MRLGRTSTFFLIPPANVSGPSVLIFILTILLLAADFYYLKNIAGRRLVGLRWWNEVDIATGDSKWVFESAEGRGDTGNRTDSRFFWLALYAQPAWWVLLAVWSLVSFRWTWLSIICELRLIFSRAKGTGGRTWIARANARWGAR